MYSDLTYIVAVVLVPLIPAFLLYKYLPAGRTDVGGPFKGLDIKLSGAFAGYFLVVLIVTSLLVFLIKMKPAPGCPPPPAHQYEVYTVTGKVDLSRSENDLAKLDYKQIDLSLAPPERSVKPDGTFSFEIPVRPGQIGQPELPDLIVDYHVPGYEEVTIHLDEKSPYRQNFTVDYNKEARTIVINPQIHPEASDQRYNPKVKAKELPSTESKP